jgi:hypothetical protein
LIPELLNQRDKDFWVIDPLDLGGNEIAPEPRERLNFGKSVAWCTSSIAAAANCIASPGVKPWAGVAFAPRAS